MTDASMNCQRCGAMVDPSVDGAAALNWVMDRRDGRTSWTCPACASGNIRAMEAKLEPEWW
ncbi:MAG: hypothetical protein ABI418_14905 [Jatrophihabitantaceae bacterium]